MLLSVEGTWRNHDEFHRIGNKNYGLFLNVFFGQHALKIVPDNGEAAVRFLNPSEVQKVWASVLAGSYGYRDYAEEDY